MTSGQKGPAASNHHETRVRSEVVALLADADGQRGDWSRWPATALYHLNGSPFTAAEAALAHSASLAELMTARRAADDRRRAFELISRVPGYEDLTVQEAVDRLPEPQRAEAKELLRRGGVEDLRD